MSKVTVMRDGEYRLLVLAVDTARGACAVSFLEVKKILTKRTIISSDNALIDLNQAQKDLEKHVKEYGVPKLGQRV